MAEFGDVYQKIESTKQEVELVVESAGTIAELLEELASGVASLGFDTRAAVRWLPDGAHGIELEKAGPITAGFDAPLEIPAELARVSIDKAREAVVEYVTTGAKPACVRWEPA